MRQAGGIYRDGIFRALQACLIMSVSGIVLAQPFQMMTRSTGGQTANSGVYNSSSPAVTPDGRYVVFESNATNLVAPATANVQQIFLHDRVLAVTELVSVSNAGGASANKPVFRPAISADGCKIVFWTDATNLATSASTAAGFYDVFLRDRCAGATTALGNGNASSKNPDISADGRWVAFESDASNLLGPAINTHGSSQIYLRDLTLPTPTLVSVAVTGATIGQGGGFSSRFPAISADGSRIAFWSFASDLVLSDTNGAWDIFLRDGTASVSLVSTAADGTQRDAGNESTSRVVEPAISADGRYVSFATTSSNLVPCIISAVCNQNVFVKDTQTGGIVLASVTSANALGNGESPAGQGERAALSGDGSNVIFTTFASNLTSDGFSGNVVMHNIVSGVTQTFAPFALFGVGARPAISGDAAGRSVAFFSSAHLDPNFASASGVFLHNRGANVRSDFDGNVKSDILWRNAASGTVVQWQMSGLTIATSGSPSTVADPNWQVVGVGDFDGDGKADLLWQNRSTGQVVTWLMNGMTIANSGSPNTVADLHWRVVAVGDFNGDGKADILWQNRDTGTPGTGMLVVWLMNGMTIANSGSPNTVSDQNWVVQGIGDFDGDGKADVLWQDRASGTVVAWLMNGMTIATSASPTTVADLHWQVQGVGDLNGDGKADILWQNRDTGTAGTGTAVVWLMNGASIATPGSPTTVADMHWQVQGVGDYDGDGKADVLWQHRTAGTTGSGQTVLWLMDGATIRTSGSPNTVADLGWQVQNPK